MQGTGDDKRMRQASGACAAPDDFQSQSFEDGAPARVLSMVAFGLAGMIVGLLASGEVSLAVAAFVALAAGTAIGWTARGCSK